MAKKKSAETYIDMELKWLEEKAEELKEFCDAKKFTELTDRTHDGKVVSKIEDQVKCIRESMKDYVQIISSIDSLREKEGLKRALVRGNQELSPIEAGEI